MSSYRHQRYFSTNSLKRTSVWHGERKCLFPLQIYTALKHRKQADTMIGGLFPLQIYTALKPITYIIIGICCLFPLQIYTALKPQIVQE